MRPPTRRWCADLPSSFRAAALVERNRKWRQLPALMHGHSQIFFFKQKTAYEIGLGIPAEPLFRSTLFPSTLPSIKLRKCSSKIITSRSEERFSKIITSRSEERRVGKECRNRLSTKHKKKKKNSDEKDMQVKHKCEDMTVTLIEICQ